MVRSSLTLTLVPLLVTATAACDETAVSLVIHSRLEIPHDLDAVCLQLAASGTFQFGQRYPLSEDQAGTPLTLSVLPGERNRSGFEVLLRGERRGSEVSWARESAAFEEHKVQEKDIYVQRCGLRKGQGTFTWVEPLTSNAGSAVAAVPIASAPSAVVVAWSGEARRFAYLDRVRQLPEGLPPVGQKAVRDLAAVDVDNDCDLDLVLLQEQGGAQVWRHGPDGTFQQQDGAVMVQGDFHHLAAADLNLDGFVDLVLVSPSEVKLLLNNGNDAGSFRDESSMLPADLGDVTDVGIGFINRGGETRIDSYPDIVLSRGNTSSNTALALINHYVDSSTLTFDRMVVTDARQARSVAVGDFDRDGLHDVVLGNVSDLPLVYINKSTANSVKLELSKNALLNVSTETVNDILAVDLDDDCDVDLVLARDTSSVIYNNEGKGVFVEKPLLPGAARLAAADIDGDDVLDLVLGGGPQGAGWLSQQKAVQ